MIAFHRSSSCIRSSRPWHAASYAGGSPRSMNGTWSLSTRKARHELLHRILAAPGAVYAASWIRLPSIRYLLLLACATRCLAAIRRRFPPDCRPYRHPRVRLSSSQTLALGSEDFLIAAMARISSRASKLPISWLLAGIGVDYLSSSGAWWQIDWDAHVARQRSLTRPQKPQLLCTFPDKSS